MWAAGALRMRTLLIDNDDSYTFNLFHLLGEVNGEEPIVVRNDEVPGAELVRPAPDNIVISPGPGRTRAALLEAVGGTLEADRRAAVAAGSRGH
jgi:anthranilate/para-aminobenzoate synthase component II